MTTQNCEKYKQSNPDARCNCDQCIEDEKAIRELKDTLSPLTINEDNK